MEQDDTRYKEMADKIEAKHAGLKQAEEQRKTDQTRAIQERGQTASQEAAEWEQRLKQMIAASGRLVPYRVEHELGSEGFGFAVTVGTANLKLLLEDRGWRIATINPRDMWPTTGLPVEPNAIRQQVLDRMLEQGLEDLFSGKVTAAKDQFRRVR